MEANPPYEITWSGGVSDPLNPNVMETSVEGNYSAFVNDQHGIINGCPPIEFPLDPISFFEFGLAEFTMSSANSDFCDVFAVSDPISFTNISTGDITSFSWAQLAPTIFYLYNFNNSFLRLSSKGYVLSLLMIN